MRKSVLVGSAFLLLGVVPLASGWAADSVPISISASDKATGAKAHPQILEEFGGAYVGPQAAYVRKVGQKIAVQSGLSNTQSDFTVTLLNSSVNNAFAIPGGYIYVTRQLLALMNDEAELASVLGHETGHVAARHASSRNRTSTIGSIGSVILGVLTGSQEIAQIASQVSQLYTLKFSRAQEFQADDLGVTYLARAGYDPLASSTMLASLAAQSTLDARVTNQNGSQLPTWASTHPDPASRVTRAAQKAAATGVTGGTRNREGFLSALNGVMYDDDPKQGIIDGQRFRHAELKLAFTAPDGFAMENGAQAVTISGTSGKAQFTSVAYSGSMRAYIDAAFKQLAGENQTIEHGDIQTTRVNGLDAAFATGRANTQSGAMDVTIFAYVFDATHAYHFAVLTPAGTGTGPFEPMLRSMSRLSTADAAAIRPRRIAVVSVKSGDTVASLSARMAYTSFRTERFVTLNALQAGASLKPGQKVKLVVQG